MDDDKPPKYEKELWYFQGTDILRFMKVLVCLLRDFVM